MMNAVAVVCRECWRNNGRLMKVAAYHLSFQYNQTRLKLLWTILNPIIQLLTYWFAFHVGMKVGSPVEGVSYLAWMLTGLVPWFFISAVLSGGLNSIISSAGTILNMRYPVSIIPACTVCTEFLTHLCYIVVLITIQLLSGIRYEVSVILLLYYLAAEFFFLLGYIYLMSSLTVFVRDFQKLIPAVVRLLFFWTPICWNAKGSAMEAIQKWNPIAYIIDGFRGSMLYGGQFEFGVMQHVYFWVFTVLLLLAGTWVHCKLKPYFVDYL